MFRFRAIRRSCPESSRWYHFQIEDGPVIFNDDCFFLCGKENTPIMFFDTIVRGHPTLKFFEGDYIYSSYDNSFLGLVVYNNGFFMQKIGESVKKEIPLSHIYVKRGSYGSTRELLKFERTPILFKYDTTEFSIMDIVSVSGGVMSLMLRTHQQRINTSGVFCMLYHNEATHTSEYEGDIFDGKILTIDNVTCVQAKANNMKEIEHEH